MLAALQNLLLSRLTPLCLGDKAPPAAVITAAIEAACAAPDHGRLRPWRYVVIEGDARQKFGELMAESLKLRDPQSTEEMLEGERRKPLRAPLIVVIACVVQESNKVPDIEQLLAVGAAAQNFQLSIHAHGYGCQWKSGIACFDPHIKAGLGFSKEDHLIGFMYVGDIAEAGRERQLDCDKWVYTWDGQRHHKKS